jgi:PASTA domain
MTGPVGAALAAAGATAVPVGAVVALLAGAPPRLVVEGNPLPHPVPARVVVVPNVVGMSVGRAEAAVSHSRLRFRPSPATIPAGARLTVAGMRPQAGSLVAPGSLVVVRLEMPGPDRPGR